MTNCSHTYCKKCLLTVQKYSILKPNYVSYKNIEISVINHKFQNEKQITCPMCLRVSKLPKGDIKEDLKYMGEIEMGIRDWQN